MHGIGNQICGFPRSLWIGRVRDAAQVMPEVHRPIGALVGEDVGFVEVECVDDVGVAQGLEENEIVVVGPVRPGGDDGVLRGAFANRAGQLGLHAVPAIAIAAFGLVEHFKENAHGIEGRVVRGQRSPKIGEFLDELVVGRQLAIRN